jgi:acyl carrier protein
MGGEKLMDELLKLLSEICPKVDFVKEKKLIDDGILDSFDIISIVNELNEHYDIEIDVDDLEPENFNSVEAMLELIHTLQNE